jgi:RNA polymerase sigma factor for flagellar operon FliA
VKHRQLLLENLDLVERLVRFVARRHHLTSADTEEFASIVRLKLVEHDFAILRKFEGRSALPTYLTVVIERLCQDFSIACWGKWRPSAAARRLGEMAILLERLVVRDGATFEEAVNTLQTNHGVTETREQLRQMFVALPVRGARWSASRGKAGDGDTDGFADLSFRSQEDETDAERVSVALAEAVSALPPEDQAILKLRFEENRSITDISAILRVEKRGLYRRVQALMRGLRTSLDTLVGHPTTLLRSVLAEMPQRESQLR